MEPIEILMSEHRVIEQALNVLEKIVERSGKDGRVNLEDTEAVLDFLKKFADGCHHAKEEQRLFPLLETKGFSRANGPTGVMCMEHDEGRTLIQTMVKVLPGAAKGEAASLEGFTEAAHNYMGLLRMHIRKEDHCLFPMAQQVMSSADRQALEKAFEQVERHDVGAGVHEQYLALADRLADKYGVAKAAVDRAAVGVSCGCGHKHN